MTYKYIFHRSCRYGAIKIPPWYDSGYDETVFFCIKTSITKYQELITPYPRPPGVPKKN
jgi:hypothetical protein